MEITETNERPEFYARIGFSRTQRNGWSGEFTVSIRGSRADVTGQMAEFIHTVEAQMLTEVAVLNAKDEAENV